LARAFFRAESTNPPEYTPCAMWRDQRGPFGGFAAGPALRLCAAALLLTASCQCARTIHGPCSARPLCSYNLRLRGGMPKVSAQRQRGNAPALRMYGAAGLCQVTSGRVCEGLAHRGSTPISVFDGYALRDRETLMPTMKNQNRPSSTPHRTHCVRVASCACVTRTGKCRLCQRQGFVSNY
jgi:hypothetical protein